MRVLGLFLLLVVGCGRDPATDGISVAQLSGHRVRAIA